jgi:nucleoside 2-deoxyribosyltransferase
MKIYLSGPMTGQPRWNFDAFAKAAAYLRAAGFEVISPAELDLIEGFSPDRPVDEFTESDRVYALRRDVRAITEVDGIALLDGWADSVGAQLEVHIGTSLELMVAPVDAFLTMKRVSARKAQ